MLYVRTYISQRALFPLFFQNSLIEDKASSSKATTSSIKATVPVPPPRSKIAPTTTKKFSRPESECSNDISNGGDTINTLPDKHRSLCHIDVMENKSGKLSKNKYHKKKKHLVMMSDESHDYSEIYTPSNEEANKGGTSTWDDRDTTSSRTGSGDSGLTASENGLQQQQQPPPRPLHRYPSWEHRIYQVAREGLPDDDLDLEKRNSLVNYGDDISVPVYATVKGGRGASQIRSV